MFTSWVQTDDEEVFGKTLLLKLIICFKTECMVIIYCIIKLNKIFKTTTTKQNVVRLPQCVHTVYFGQRNHRGKPYDRMNRLHVTADIEFISFFVRS